MLDCRYRLRFVIVGLAAATASAVLTSPSFGQQQIGSADDVTEMNKSGNREQFTKLRDGEVLPDKVKDKSLLQTAARYFVGRVTWVTLQKTKPYDAGMGKVQGDFSKELMAHKDTQSGKNKVFIELLVQEIIPLLDKVVKPENKYEPEAVTNAALMLPVLARCKQPAVHDFLLELAKTDANGKPVVLPFVRMCAIKGMGVLNAPDGPKVDSPTEEGQKARRNRELAEVEAIVQFIEQPYPPEGSDPEHEAAFVYVRREGVKALAQLPVAALFMDVKKDVVKGPIAYHLLKIADGTPVKVGPPFTLSEKVEAALGLCRIKPADLAHYNAELTASVLGNVLVEFTKAYKQDYQYFSQDKEKDGPNRVTKLPWKSYSVRLDAGLNEFHASLTGDPAAQKKVDGLRNNARGTLTGISKHADIDLDRKLPDYVQTMRPALTEVYKGIKGFALPAADK